MSSFYATAISDKRFARIGWGPTNAIAETWSRTGSRHTNGGILSTGRLTLAGGCIIPAGVRVSNITFVSGTTALSVGSNQWFCLVDQSNNVLAKTADDTSTAWGAGTAKTLALSTAYTPSSTIAVYLGIVVVATTPPSLIISESNSATGVASLTPLICANADTSLTNPASLGATATPTGVSGGVAYAYLT